VSSVLLLKSIDGIHYSPVSWNGKALTDSFPSPCMVYYRLEINADTGKYSDSACIEIYDSTPLSISAGISAPSIVYEGESFQVGNTSIVNYGIEALSFEEAYLSGLASSYAWDAGGCSGSLGISGGTLTKTLSSSNPEDVEIRLTASDKDGNTSTASRIIKVLPCPYPGIEVTGTLKENRLVTVKSSASTHPSYPVSGASIEVVPLTAGVSQSDVKKSSASNINEAYFIFKKAGDYKAIVSITDIRGHSSLAEQCFTICADLSPVSGLNTTSVKIRDPLNLNRALFKVVDKDSRSFDQDTVARRAWSYRYDSDMDGDYSDETHNIVSNDNLQSVDMHFDKVGKYRIFLDIREMFGTLFQPQPTLPEFITESDYKTHGSYLDVEVDNVPPVAMLNVARRRNINVKLVLGNSPLTGQIKAQADSLRSLLATKGIIGNVEVAEHTPDYLVSHWDHLRYDTEVDLNLNNASNQPSLHRIYAFDPYGNEIAVRTVYGASYLDKDGILYFAARGYAGKYRIYAMDSSKRDAKIYVMWESSAVVYAPIVNFNIYSPSRPKTGIYASKTIPGVLYYLCDTHMSGYDQLTKIDRKTGAVFSQLLSSSSSYAALYNDISWDISNPHTSSLPVEANFEVTKGVDRTITDSFGNTYHVYFSNNTTFMTATMADGTVKNVSFGGTISLDARNMYPAGRFKLTVHNNKPLVFLTSAGTCGSHGSYQYYFSTAILYGSELLQNTSYYGLNYYADTMYSHGPEFFVARFNGKLAITHYRSNIFNSSNVLEHFAERETSKLRAAAASYPGIRNDILFATDQNGCAFFTSDGSLAAMNGADLLFFGDKGADQRSFVSVNNLLADVSVDEGSTRNYLVYVNSSDLKDFGNAAALVSHADVNRNTIISVSDITHRPQAEYLARTTGGIYIKEGSGTPSGTITVGTLFSGIAQFIDEHLGTGENGLKTILINETVDYSTDYYDYENDPIVSSRWKYVHEPNYFDNANGTASFHNALLGAPVTNFGTKTGRYRVIYQVLDDPPGSSPGDWSGEGEYYIVVHRKPVCIVNLDCINPVNRNPDGSFKVNATLSVDMSQSYDFDLQFRDAQKGIQGFKFVCRKPDGRVETHFNRQYLVLDMQGDWHFSFQVQDKQGEWSNVAERAVKVLNVGTLQRSISAQLRVSDRVYVGQKAKVLLHDVKTINCSLQSQTVQIRKLGDGSQGTGDGSWGTEVGPWGEVNAAVFLAGNHVMQQVGTFEVRYRAYNNYGSYSEVLQVIEVGKVSLNAEIAVSGARKVNRKVTLELAETAGSIHAIDRVVWTVSPVAGGVGSDINIAGSLNSPRIDTLYKKAGTYRAQAVIYTTIDSVEYSKTLSAEYSIAPDLPPVLSVSASTPVFRAAGGTRSGAEGSGSGKAGSGAEGSGSGEAGSGAEGSGSGESGFDAGGMAPVKLDLQAISPDDYISAINWYVAYDSDNDGSFADEADVRYYEADGERNPTVMLGSGVGKYRIRAVAIEGYSDETIPGFVIQSDYLTSSASTVVEVANNAPYVDFGTEAEVYLVGEPVAYLSGMTGGIVNKSGDIYHDSENDPIYSFVWRVEHETNIMPKQDGLSIYDGTETPEPVTVFDRSGKYTISAWAFDDPKPADSRFASYRKQSYIATKDIIVHRPPKAELTFAAVGHVSENIAGNYNFGNGNYLEGTFIKVLNKSSDPDGYPVVTSIVYKHSGGSYSPLTDGSSVLLDKPGAYNFRVETVDNYGAQDVELYVINVLRGLDLIPGISPNPVPASETVALTLETNSLATSARAVILGQQIPLSLTAESASGKVWEAQFTIPSTCKDGSY
ncbi:MAG: hypothetical protein PHV32_13320, partial [Eubacteriales bacterium]|nr:hypothetical protein [Eubacteriales bacterium]